IDIIKEKEELQRKILQTNEVLAEQVDHLKAQLSDKEKEVSHIRQKEQLTSEMKSMLDSTYQEFNTLQSKIQKLETQLNAAKLMNLEYEDLKEGRIVITEISNLSELPKTLIKARIANGLTQAELASRLNLKMQQIQRYEADEYNSASLKTLLRIASELNLTVSADVQIKSFDDPQLVNAKNYPFKQMFQRGWFGNFVGTLNDAIKDSENLIEGLFENAGFKGVQPALNRQLIRSNSQPNEFALKAWYARILTKAKEQRIDKSFDKNFLTPDWIGNLAKLSQEEDGLKKVPKYLKDVGIRFIIEPVLDGTLLDGAALLLDKQHIHYRKGTACQDELRTD
ncbi:MAG: helix-turn-helix domain-containing protein, partial [Hymenobacter sp.]